MHAGWGMHARRTCLNRGRPVRAGRTILANIDPGWDMTMSELIALDALDVLQVGGTPSRPSPCMVPPVHPCLSPQAVFADQPLLELRLFLSAGRCLLLRPHGELKRQVSYA